MTDDDRRSIERELRRRYGELLAHSEGGTIQLNSDVPSIDDAEFSVHVEGDPRRPNFVLRPTTINLDFEQTERGVLRAIDRAFSPSRTKDLGCAARAGLQFAMREVSQLAKDTPEAFVLIVLTEVLHLSTQVSSQHDPERKGLYLLASRGLGVLFQDLMEAEPPAPHRRTVQQKELRGWSAQFLASRWRTRTEPGVAGVGCSSESQPECTGRERD
jgi:hypothetical protein